MVELKDDEFAMGHAYRFGSRISIYKPNCAIIVSTKGVSPDVKDHFRRADQEAEFVYVENLNEIETTFHRLIEKARCKRASEIMSNFEPIRMSIS